MTPGISNSTLLHSRSQTGVLDRINRIYRIALPVPYTLQIVSRKQEGGGL